MSATYEELTTALTEEAAQTIVLGLLQASGFPTTSWAETSVPRRLVFLIAALFSDVRTHQSDLAKAMILDNPECAGDLLTFIARAFYNRTRAAAVFTEGVFRLEDDGGAPYDIDPGQLQFRHVATGLLFTNTTGGTLDVGDTLDISIKAEQAGDDYNVATLSDLEIVTTLEGVNVTNPDTGSGSWITIAGADEQGDESLKRACKAQWATLGAGTEEAYIAWALEGAPTVTKIKVRTDQPLGPGTVQTVLANDSGTATDDEVEDADAVIQARRPAGLGPNLIDPTESGVQTIAATAVSLAWGGTVNVKSAYAANYQTALQSYVTDLQREQEIGASAYHTQLIEVLHSPPGVRNVTGVTPGTDTEATATEIIVYQAPTIAVVAV